jgi:hypothetical protein
MDSTDQATPVSDCNPSLIPVLHVVPDTRFYWHLTKHIFRFSPSFDTDYYNGAHTVNEGKYFTYFVVPLAHAVSVYQLSALTA